MIEDYQILWNVLFKCIKCYKILNCEDIYTYLDFNRERDYEPGKKSPFKAHEEKCECFIKK